MIKKILSSLVICILVFAGMGQSQLVVVNKNCVFFAPGKGHYVESNFLIPGTKIRYVKNENGKYQGGIEVTLVYKSGSEIRAFEKYILNSVELEDSTHSAIGLIDLKRKTLEAGTYLLEGNFVDLNDSSNRTSLSETFEIPVEKQQITISDISLVDKYESSDAESPYVKNGIHITPYVHEFFPTSISQLTFFGKITKI